MRQTLRTVRAVCPHDCPDTCSIHVTVDDATGRAVKVRGNPDHPFTAGFLCAKVNRYLDRVYHPERLQYPQRRVGRKGEGCFERISWSDAIATIASNIRRISDEHGPQAILPYSYAGTMGKVQGSSLDRRFFHRLGASLLDRTICASAGSAGSDITFGPNRRAAIDPEAAVDCKLIINWGSNTSVTNMHFWRIEHEARKRGAKIITIDPYRSPTAQKSDQWIPIRPGTDAALALGVMHILVRDGLQDQEYLDQYCDGSETLQQRALSEYPPEKVSTITGLEVATIEQFAAEYGTTRPSLIRLNYGLQRHGGGGMAVRTITCLPAFTGDWRHPGAGALLSTSKEFPGNADALERPDQIPPGTRTINMTQLAEALNGELPGPPVQMIVVYNSNPGSIAPNQSKVIRGFEREDLFTVVMEHFLTDTARYADILLPATTQLEHWDVHTAYGHLDLQVNAPSIAPLAEAKPNTEVFRLLAKAMNFEPELFDVSDEDLIREWLGSHEITLDRLVKEGPIRVVPAHFAPFAQGNFGTQSGKCNLASPLPNYTPPHEDPQTKPALAAKYPLQLLTPPSPTFLNSTFVNVDHLRNEASEPTVELNAADAGTRSILDGDRVTIFNSRGRFQAKAMISDNVKPGVAVSTGCWWSKYTADGANVNATTSTALTDFGAGATFFDNLVEIQKL